MPKRLRALKCLRLAASFENEAGVFLPPQDQPRAERLKWVAHLLEDAMFQNRNSRSSSP